MDSKEGRGDEAKGASSQGKVRRPKSGGMVDHHCCLDNSRDLIKSILDRLQTSERVQQEEHVALIAMLNKMHYFHCHVRELVVVVWHAQILLKEKVEKLESWMVHFKEHVQCFFYPLPPPRTALNNPASITLDE